MTVRYVLLYYKAAVHRNLFTAKAAEMEVEGSMKRRLQLASDRECGRKSRLLIKEDIYSVLTAVFFALFINLLKCSYYSLFLIVYKSPCCF